MFPVNRSAVKNHDAFTLLEIMVSISIIAIVMVSLFRMHAATIGLAEKVAFNTVASHLARQKSTEICMDLQDAVDDQGDFGDAFPGYSWQSIIGDMVVFDEEMISVKQAEHMMRIDLTVSLGERHSFTLRTWIYDDINGS